MTVVQAIETELSTIDVQLAELTERRGVFASMLEQARALTGGAPAPAALLPATPTAAPAEVKKPAKSSTPRAPRASSRTRVAGGRTKVSADAVLATVKEAGDWVSAGDVAEKLEATRSAIRAHLAGMVNAGTLEAKGATNSRRYRTATAPREAVAAPVVSNQKRGHLLKLLRVAVVEAIAADPGALTEDRLVQALSPGNAIANREEIALVCGELLEAERVRLAGNGTYFPAARAEPGEIQGGGLSDRGPEGRPADGRSRRSGRGRVARRRGGRAAAAAGGRRGEQGRERHRRGLDDRVTTTGGTP